MGCEAHARLAMQTQKKIGTKKHLISRQIQGDDEQSDQAVHASTAREDAESATQKLTEIRCFLPSEVSKGLVCLSHLVSIFSFLYSVTFVFSSQNKFVGKFFNNRLPLLSSGTLDNPS